MSDPRIDKLANAFAILLVAIIDVAKGSSEDAVVEEFVPPKKRRAAQPAESSADTSASAEPASDASPDPKASSQQTGKPSSTAGTDAVIGDPDLFEKVKELTKDISKAKGREAAVELLGTFGAERATALKPDQWAEYVEAAEAVLEGDLV